MRREGEDSEEGEGEERNHLPRSRPLAPKTNHTLDFSVPQICPSGLKLLCSFWVVCYKRNATFSCYWPEDRLIILHYTRLSSIFNIVCYIKGYHAMLYHMMLCYISYEFYTVLYKLYHINICRTIGDYRK